MAFGLLTLIRITIQIGDRSVQAPLYDHVVPIALLRR